MTRLKLYVTIFVILISILFAGCNKCKDIACFTPPTPFEIEFLDSASKENLITNRTYSFNQIEVVNIENGKRISFDTVSYEQESYIRLTDIGWKTGKVNYLIAIPNEFEFTLFVDAARLEGNCCDFTKINEMSISSYEYEENKSTDRISVFIER